jgi:hypothetical protein
MAAILISSLDHMRLSITTAPDNSAYYVRILGDVDLSEFEQPGLAARELIGDHANADARESDPSTGRDRWMSA